MKDCISTVQKDEREKNSLRGYTIEKLVFADDVHFTTILNPALQSHIRDAMALGIYCYLMSLPQDLKIMPKQLASHFGLTVEMVCKKLQVLIEAGYMYAQGEQYFMSVGGSYEAQ